MNMLLVILPGLAAVAAFALLQQRGTRVTLVPAEVADAGGADWRQVMGALVTEPDRLADGELEAPLGLRVLETMRVTRSMAGHHKDVSGRTAA